MTTSLQTPPECLTAFRLPRRLLDTLDEICAELDCNRSSCHATARNDFPHKTTLLPLEHRSATPLAAINATRRIGPLQIARF
jgi:hypothetical protein